MKAEKTPFDEEMRMATRGYFGGLGGFSKKFCQMRCLFWVPVGCCADWRKIKWNMMGCRMLDNDYNVRLDIGEC